MQLVLNYVTQLKARMMDRLDFVNSMNTKKAGYDKLPEDAAAAIQKIVDQTANL